MVMAWAILLPAGALWARYFKVLPSQNWPDRLDNKIWWHAHRALQCLGMTLATLGAAVAWQHTTQAGPLARLHGYAGWLLMFLGGLQILSGLLRGTKGGPTDKQDRGDHYDMTVRRRWFERVHKGLGWMSLLAAMAVMGMGLLLADAPRWMPLVLLVWWLVLASLAWRWQRQGRCIDTYQAIWGTDKRHPGNQLPPIGWGIRRPFDTQKHGQS
ncbi:cytochrome B [Limnohabitans sp. T6-5]|nr:cytochrome B [Limnohabitans sp. T6-5]